ncbi:migration and invasion-inhibitory protein isoform X2 [Phyllostomus hastatus]|uniref:migration and invasion-inhibitory protein isoform X2 n=1 Tax=Phyllostomus hastatus TaxID=9423 RepID=UPI001E67F787|nr:migration and invasion-inhibitory protein isoform X2 [Phyllostomus hastatus]
MPGMEETRDLAQLRQLNLELLRQLWAGQDAVQRSVAKAAAESSRDCRSSYNSEVPSSQEKFSMALRASCPRDASQRDSCDMSSPGGASSGVTSLPPPKCRHQESLSPLRPCSAPLGATSDSNGPERSAELEAPASWSISGQQSKLPKPRVTFSKESSVPEESWRFRPYLGYDWIAGSLDNSSPVSGEPEDFFSRLQEFREANKEECIHSDPDVGLPGLWESAVAEEDHECVYCYRVNRRLFLVPWDPGTPCRLCRIPRDQQGPKTLADPAQVRVSIPASILDPPHRHRIHRRKSLDACDSLALPRHCLRGWDIVPPRSQRSSALKSLDLWSCVASEAQPQKPSADPHHPAPALSAGCPVHPSRTLTLRPRRR